MQTNQPTNGTGTLGGPSAQAALTWRQLTGTAVTQRELGLYLELSEQARRHRLLRDDLLARLEAGAMVEPGPLAVRVECVPRRVLSARVLAGALGEERVRQLRAEVEPTLHRHVVVSGAPHGAGRGDSGRPAGAP
jgi:hypothetical protein